MRQQALRLDRGSVSAQAVKPSSPTATRDFETISQRWFDLADDERDGLKCHGALDWTGPGFRRDSSSNHHAAPLGKAAIFRPDDSLARNR